MKKNDSVFSKEKKLMVTPMIGVDIVLAIQEAVFMSKSKDVIVSFDFNGQEVVVDQNSTVESVYKNWCNKIGQAGMECKRFQEYTDSQEKTDMSRHKTR